MKKIEYFVHHESGFKLFEKGDILAAEHLKALKESGIAEVYAIDYSNECESFVNGAKHKHLMIRDIEMMKSKVALSRPLMAGNRMLLATGVEVDKSIVELMGQHGIQSIIVMKTQEDMRLDQVAKFRQKVSAGGSSEGSDAKEGVQMTYENKGILVVFSYSQGSMKSQKEMRLKFNNRMMNVSFGGDDKDIYKVDVGKISSVLSMVAFYDIDPKKFDTAFKNWTRTPLLIGRMNKDLMTLENVSQKIAKLDPKYKPLSNIITFVGSDGDLMLEVGETPPNFPMSGELVLTYLKLLGIINIDVNQVNRAVQSRGIPVPVII